MSSHIQYRHIKTSSTKNGRWYYVRREQCDMFRRSAIVARQRQVKTRFHGCARLFNSISHCGRRYRCEATNNRKVWALKWRRPGVIRRLDPNWVKSKEISQFQQWIATDQRPDAVNSWVVTEDWTEFQLSCNEYSRTIIQHLLLFITSDCECNYVANKSNVQSKHPRLFSRAIYTAGM
jgi:hypothetical protein